MTAEYRLAQSMGIPYKIEQIKLNGYDINFLVAGSGPPVLLIHGLNMGWGQWHLNIPALAKKFTVYAIDLPGGGGSTKIDFSKSDLVKDFVGTAEEFVKNKCPDGVRIIGHSLGGWVAIKLAERGRVKIEKLVLINSLGFSSYLPIGERPICFSKVARFLAKTAVKFGTAEEIKKFLKSVMVSVFNLKKEFVDYLQESIGGAIESNPLILTTQFLVPCRVKDEFVMLKTLPGIKLPTLIMAGDKDPHMPIKKVSPAWDLISGAKIKIFKNIGHTPFIEAPEEFNGAIISFLE